jgi:hypothetical protein
LTLLTVRESRDPNRSRSIDFAGTVLIAGILVPLLLAFSEGSDWGWTSLAVIGCFVISALAVVAFYLVEKRVTAPLVDLALLKNRVLIGATLAILIVAGAINALMYVLSLYFQDPAGFGMSALEAGLATLPAAAVMIAVTPLITPIALRIGSLRAVAFGFLLTTIAFAILVFVTDSWKYSAFVAPLVVLAAGLGLANGPASSASTSSVSADQVGQAAGISNMARYIGGSLVVAVIATIYNDTATNHVNGGATQAQALAAGVSRSAFALAIISFCGVLLAVLMRRHQARKPRAVDLAAAAAITTHTIVIPETT